MAAALERSLYKRSAAVVAVTRPFCEHIDRIRRASPKSVLIPNGTLEQFFVSNDRSARPRLGLGPGRFLVVFAGTHGIAQGLHSAVEAAGRANGVHFAFIGEGPVKNSLVAEAQNRGLENISFHSQIPMDQIPAILAASDALLVPLSAHPTFADFVPSKLFDFMAAGRPVILSAQGESARIVKNAGGGLVVEPERPDALADAAEWLAAHPREAEEMGKRGREFARNRLRRVQAERLEQVLLHLAGARP